MLDFGLTLSRPRRSLELGKTLSGLGKCWRKLREKMPKRELRLVVV